MRKLVTKQNQTLKSTTQRVFRSINDDLNAHVWRYGLVFVLHGWLLATIFSQPAMSFVFVVLGIVEAILVAMTVGMLFDAARKPGRLVHEWALQENQHQTITALKGKTTEELEQMLQYHMENGNIEAADRISQQLLQMVDGIPAVEPEPAPVAEVVKKSDDGVAIKVKTGLPSWMDEGKTAAEDEQQQQQSSLPDWMKS